MKSFLENTKLIFSIGVLITVFSLVYYFLIFKPDIENRRLEIQQKELDIQQQQAARIEEEANRAANSKTENEVLFASCIENAHKQYDGSWSNGCKQLGRPANCTDLPHNIAESLDKSLQTTKLNCAKLYK